MAVEERLHEESGIAHPSKGGGEVNSGRSAEVVRRMTPAERRCAVPRFPWSDIALAPLNGVLARSAPAVVLAGLPLFLILWLVGVGEPGGWVSLLGLGAFGLTSAMALYTALGGFLRTRARIDDDLLDDEVEDRVVQVTDAVAVVADPPVLYLRLDGGTADGLETIVLIGDYLTRLRRTGCFPSTTLRVIQLPRSRAVVGLLPMGEVLPLEYVSGTDDRPVEFDGQSSSIDFERLARASG